MFHKHKFIFIISSILLVSMTVISAAAGWKKTLSQTDMGMSTGTMQPEFTQTPASPVLQGTPTPSGADSISASPTMTSIFTGFTPYPNSISTDTALMGGCGTSCGMGGSSGMVSGGGMATGSMNMGGGSMIGGSGMNSTGSMGTMGMDMSGCSMMSGSEMSSMGTSDDLWMVGMDMSGSSLDEYDSSSVTTDPWWILGWVVLGLVGLAILVAAAFGIVWVIRRSRQTPPV